jgi:hypothetical protein
LSAENLKCRRSAPLGNCDVYIGLYLFAEPGPFAEGPDDLETQTQCLLAFHRFGCHTGTRAELLKDTKEGKVLDVIENDLIELLAATISGAALRFISSAVSILHTERIGARRIN